MWSEWSVRRRACGALALGLAVALSASVPVAAKARTKKPRAAEEFGLAAAFDVLSPAVSPRSPKSVGAAAPLRFFTINQVLAKQDRLRGGDAVQLAAIHPGTLSDAPASSPPRGEEPFGMSAFRAPEGVLWTKWRGVERAMESEAATISRCDREPETCPSAAALRFLSLVEAAREQSGPARLEAVSHAVNAQIRYTSDMAQHGVADLWSAPLATLTSRRGDCEDYAIAKYAVLRAAGVAPETLRIVLLRDTASREDHAVLAAREDGRWFILDNRRAGFYQDAALPHYMPLFALGQNGVQVFAAPYAMRPQHESETIAPATADAVAPGGSRGDAPLLL
jgi:predicted transglutaminase-like cysteine proteinase